MVRNAAIAVGVIALTALFIWGGFGLCSHAILALDAIKDDATALKPAIQNISQVTDVMKQSSTSQAHSAAAIERDVRAEMWYLDRSLTTLDATLTAYGTIPAHLNGVADTASQSAQALAVTLQTANSTVQSLQAPINGFARDADDLDALLKDRAIHRTLDQTADLIQNANGIAADGRRVADKVSEDYLKPVPWWQWPLKRFGDIWDISAAVARHAP